MYVRYYKINNEDALIIVTISSLSLSILINVLLRFVRSLSPFYSIAGVFSLICGPSAGDGSSTIGSFD